jgi:hypothetical protein
MKYYDNLRLVIEIQSRLREWSDQEQSAAPAAENGKAKANNSQQKPEQQNQKPEQKNRVSTDR